MGAPFVSSTYPNFPQYSSLFSSCNMSESSRFYTFSRRYRIRYFKYLSAFSVIFLYFMLPLLKLGWIVYLQFCSRKLCCLREFLVGFKASETDRKTAWMIVLYIRMFSAFYRNLQLRSLFISSSVHEQPFMQYL